MISKEVLDSEIIEVIDHHPYYEYESFWKDRDTNFILDEIGSVCTIIFEKIKSEKISAMITLSEESRRMQDMMKMYSMPGMDMGAFGKEGETLILNANHPLVQYIMEHTESDNVGMICEQLYDLALLQHAPLEPEAMSKFVARSNDIMMLLAK